MKKNIKNIIKDFLNYIIRNKETLNIPEYFNFVENIIHFDKKHYSENSNTKSYEFKLENLFKNLYE